MDVKSKDQDKDNTFSNADANGELLHFKELHIEDKVSSSSQQECKDITGWKKLSSGKITWQ